MPGSKQYILTLNHFVVENPTNCLIPRPVIGQVVREVSAAMQKITEIIRDDVIDIDAADPEMRRLKLEVSTGHDTPTNAGFFQELKQWLVDGHMAKIKAELQSKMDDPPPPPPPFSLDCL